MPANSIAKTAFFIFCFIVSGPVFILSASVLIASYNLSSYKFNLSIVLDCNSLL